MFPTNDIKALKKISIKDIAEELKVSKTLVSLVLNGKAKENRIAKEMEIRVKETAERLDYRPNPFARSLRSGRSQTIGVIVADISSKFFSMIAKTIEDEAAKYDYKVMFGSTDESSEKLEELLKVFKDRRLDGYIISPSIGTEKQILQLKREQTQMVLIDRHFPKIKTDFIGVDNYQASYNAVQYLIDNGYQNIGMLSTLSKNYSLRLRLDGYKAALRENGIRVKNRLIREVDFLNRKEEIDREMEDLIHGPLPIDALFFTNCDLTGYALEKIYNMGIQVPNELAIISFDDPQCFRYSFSPITAIAQPIEEMGRQAVKILMDKINHTERKAKEFQQIILPTNFIIRESSSKKHY